MKSAPAHTIFQIHSLILLSHLCLGLSISSLLVLRLQYYYTYLNFLMSATCLANLATLDLFTQKLGTTYEAPHYVIFAILLLLTVSFPTMINSSF